MNEGLGTRGLSPDTIRQFKSSCKVPGPLDDDEWQAMKQHTIIGHNMLKGSTSHLLRTAAEIALNHHERYDGTGYPHGLEQEQIPLFGRISALSDVFDALTSSRPYKQAFPVAESIEEIVRGSGRQFDPKLVQAFRTALPEILRLREEFSDDAQHVRRSAIAI